MYPKESILEKAPPPAVKCDYYKVEKVVTDEFEKEWLDGIEKECGIRPEIVETYIVTPDVAHHLCSARRHTLLFSMGYTLANYSAIEDADGDAEAIEELTRECHQGEETAKYFGYSDFWNCLQDDDWKPDTRIPDTNWSNCPDGPWIEHVGSYDESKIGMREAWEIFIGDYEEDEQ